MPEQVVHTKNEKVGEVVSDKMAKTIVVQVTRRVKHPMYKRVITKRAKFYAHDEENAAKVGDVVRIIECRPMSHLKRWRLGEIVRRAVQVEAVETNADTTTRKKVKKKGQEAGPAR
jgi:small subunit ribosomal protein S17